MGMTTGKPQPVVKGYKPARRLYKLDFSETGHAGLQVTARGTGMEGLLRLMEIADEVESLGELDEKKDVGEMAKRMRELFAPFARVIVAWNLLDDDDQPVPASLEGLLTQDPEFIGFILAAYIQAMSSAPPPLPAASSSGASSPEEAMAAAALSSALPSSPEQRLLSAYAGNLTACPGPEA